MPGLSDSSSWATDGVIEGKPKAKLSFCTLYIHLLSQCWDGFDEVQEFSINVIQDILSFKVTAS